METYYLVVKDEEGELVGYTKSGKWLYAKPANRRFAWLYTNHADYKFAFVSVAGDAVIPEAIGLPQGWRLATEKDDASRSPGFKIEVYLP